MRLISIFFICLVLVSAVSLFKVKYKVQDLRKDLVEINRQLDEERVAFHILKAEWSYLNSPQRLKELSAKFLNLKEIEYHQIVQIDQNLIVAESNKNKLLSNLSYKNNTQNIHEAQAHDELSIYEESSNDNNQILASEIEIKNNSDITFNKGNQRSY